MVRFRLDQILVERKPPCLRVHSKNPVLKPNTLIYQRRGPRNMKHTTINRSKTPYIAPLRCMLKRSHNQSAFSESRINQLMFFFGSFRFPDSSIARGWLSLNPVQQRIIISSFLPVKFDPDDIDIDVENREELDFTTGVLFSCRVVRFF